MRKESRSDASFTPGPVLATDESFISQTLITSPPLPAILLRVGTPIQPPGVCADVLASVLMCRFRMSRRSEFGWIPSTLAASM